MFGHYISVKLLRLLYGLVDIAPSRSEFWLR